MNLIADLAVEVDPEEMLRGMGYPERARIADRVRAACDEQSARVAELADPWGAHVDLPIESIDGDRMRCAGDRVFTSRRLVSLVRRAELLAVALVTLGPRVGEEIRRLACEDRLLDAQALDAAASSATSGLMDRVGTEICREAVARNYGTTVRYAPGYTGWPIQDLPAVFSCVDGQDVPVALSSSFTMIPEKSLLTVVGLVPGGHPSPDIDPCTLCDLRRCSMRRAPRKRARTHARDRR
jgi:hypothetical protein